ncbi:LysR family transcriptional regulator [Sphingobium sp. SCG-1]|uniref:LysR family transcriptional regulator n=1 Tax=Sphingobium sp. SCG-1 TaxID=2072936 RepID=UPI000CD6C089|nr:LysR substrate-binding domain-containing protein [Sphingobium sp. SCG-1]AUW58969.1 LysR family transcriptional regulator [Sphingobium sp. SCG-1]
MDLRQLRYFIAVAETRNFHRAAERMNVSQPPITVAIRRLESELGQTLFLREPRGVTLTPAGQAALPYAREAIIAADQLKGVVRDGASGLRGRLRLGIIGSATHDLLPRVVPNFCKAFPNVQLELEEMTSVDIVQALGNQLIDVGFIRLPVIDTASVQINIIERDELVIVLPATDPLAGRKRMALAQLADRPFVLFNAISILNAITHIACQRAGFSPHIQQHATQVHTVLSLVEAGLGVALIPGRSARFISDRLRIIRLSEPIPIELGIAFPPDASPLARNFVTTALQVCDSQMQSHTAD